MDILIVTKKHAGEPGRIKNKASSLYSKESLLLLGAGAVSILNPATAGVFGGLLGKKLGDSLKRLNLNIPNPREEVSNSKSFIEMKANVIDKKTLVGSGLKYNDEIFSGVFLNKTQYEFMVKNLPSDDSDLVICDPSIAYSIYGVSVSQPGVYIAENNFVVPANNFSGGKLERVRVAILETFSNLGASRISVKDVTDSNIDMKTVLSKDLFKNSVNLGISHSKKLEFDFSVGYNASNSSVDLARAKKAVLGLDCVPELSQVAQHLILKPGSTSNIRKTVSLDISFGVKTELVSVFQGSYEGGYNRKFSVEIDF
ncbi:hypothetical protein [Pseudomonas weihenstephanensis]|uniref:hypothetical protein n=1 Tax=Pseudomonas weihenstephanensis TaxID=1608994 RepID=UPI000A91591C|nr:hypothetical protein [Pseudomonas weihenstephanensis]